MITRSTTSSVGPVGTVRASGDQQQAAGKDARRVHHLCQGQSRQGELRRAARHHTRPHRWEFAAGRARQAVVPFRGTAPATAAGSARVQVTSYRWAANRSSPNGTRECWRPRPLPPPLRRTCRLRGSRLPAFEMSTWSRCSPPRHAQEIVDHLTSIPARCSRAGSPQAAPATFIDPLALTQSELPRW